MKVVSLFKSFLPKRLSPYSPTALSTLCLLFSLASQPALASPNDDFLGTQISATGFANLNIGGMKGTALYETSYRFTGQYDGELSAFQVLWIAKTVKTYSKGTGGTIRITLRKGDSSPVPGEVIAETIYRPSLTAGDFVDGQINNAKKFALLRFADAPTIKKDQIYHLTFQNVDADPDNNFISVNALFNWSENNSNSSPTLSDTELSALHHAIGNPWKVRAGYIPVMALHIDTNGDGVADTHQGVGFTGADQDGHIENEQTLGGTTRYRQLIRPRFTFIAEEVNLSAGKIAGSKGITATLKDSSGKTLATALLPASEFRNDSDSSGECNSGEKATRCRTWGGGALSSRVTLQKGQQYLLEFSAPPGESYHVTGLKDGAFIFGLPQNTTFPEGHAEISVDGGATYTAWQSKKLDLEFFLEGSTSREVPDSSDPTPTPVSTPVQFTPTPLPTRAPTKTPVPTAAPATASIDGIYLINADNGQIVKELQNRGTIDLSDLGVSRVSIMAKVTGRIQYAQFRLNENYTYGLDDQAPYTMTPPLGGTRTKPLPIVSGKRMKVTVYLKGAKEVVLDKESVFFTIKK